MYKQIIQEIKKSEKNNNDLSYLNNVKINPEHGKKIAQIYHDMKHDPDHPEVKQAYSALIEETKQQFNDLVKKGLKISRIEPGMENPYKNSKELHADVKNNNHLWYFPTELGYGNNEQSANHPMLQPVDIKHGDKNLLANDLFRIVHDINGHHIGGESGFGPTGEHRAYLTHKKMYSPLAGKALASETMGQNSWVNFGPHAEHNQKNPAQTIYAEQKAGLLPDEIINGLWHTNEIQKGELMEILTDFALKKSFDCLEKYPKVSKEELKKNFNKLLRNGVALLGLAHGMRYIDDSSEFKQQNNKLIPEINVSQEIERDRRFHPIINDYQKNPEKQDFSDSRQNKINHFLKTTSMVESSGGKNLKHPTIKSGVHAGDKAIGQWALMPKTIKEIAGRMADNPEIAPYAKMDSKKITQKLSQNPHHEEKIASFLANKLYDKFEGDENKMAYAWNQGHNIDPQSLKTTRKNYLNHDYVKKYNKYKNESNQESSGRSVANFEAKD